MIYQQLFEKFGAGKTIQAGVIGTGHFATAIVTQSQSIPLLSVPVICDQNVEAARRAYGEAGLSSDEYAICANRSAAVTALERGQPVIVPDAMLMMDLPIDVVVESTGVPEASALHAAAAIENGKHVAMVSKEVDVTVGPILKYRAERAGLVYTAVDGDQHGLLIALVRWAQDLGLEVVCAGKGLESDLVWDEAASTISHHQKEIYIDPDHRHLFTPGPPEQTREYVQQRRAVLGDFGMIAGYDIVEMTIAANATRLGPDVAELHAPVARIAEIPEVLAPVADGGLLTTRGIMDSIVCLRNPYEAGLGGGVFIVVACENKYSRHILHTKGLISNRAGTTALIYRPYHLCGVETPVSILVAGLLEMATGATEYRPIYDVVARATVDLNAGDPVGTDHSQAHQALMCPAQPAVGTAPIPLHMAARNPLVRNVPAGAILTVDMVQAPTDSTLWSLRAEQDQIFLSQ